MRRKADHVLQFKVTLKRLRPPVWRRIQVLCDASFWDLHVAIQDAMGWRDRHLHEFRIKTPVPREVLRVGIPDDDFGAVGSMIPDIMPGWHVPVAGFLNLMKRKCVYVYDYGDCWEHDVMLEKIMPREKEVAYPRCIGGRRACPPEDSGGIAGYENLLEAIADPEHPEHRETMDWLDREFDPARFDKNAVVFGDPEERLDLVLDSGPASDDCGHEPLSFDGAAAARADNWTSGVEPPSPMLDLIDMSVEGFRGFPVVTIALYGPDDRRATKIVAATVSSMEGETDEIRRWRVPADDHMTDIRSHEATAREIADFAAFFGAATIVFSDGIMGCPHEEGIDHPAGIPCPFCPYWSGDDTGAGPGATLH